MSEVLSDRLQNGMDLAVSDRSQEISIVGACWKFIKAYAVDAWDFINASTSYMWHNVTSKWTEFQHLSLGKQAAIGGSLLLISACIRFRKEIYSQWRSPEGRKQMLSLLFEVFELLLLPFSEIISLGFKVLNITLKTREFMTLRPA